MSRFTLRILITLLTFVGGVAAASVWMVSRLGETEQPPCRSCASIYTSPEIPSVTVCELTAGPALYRGRMVRVKAMFYHDAGHVDLHDETCGGRVHAGLSNIYESCAGTRKALKMYSGFGTWYDSAASVVVVGSLGRLEDATLYDDGNDGFNLVCLEQAEPIGSGVWERIYYTVGELFGLSWQ